MEGEKMELNELFGFDLPENLSIVDSYAKAESKLRGYSKIMCSISGGADSDIMIDILTKLDKQKRIHYVWFDTGIEYQATKDHLETLEKKYGITIERIKPKIPIPLSCRKYGVPFMSKYASQMISRLQKHGFKWENRPYEELVKKFPRCVSGLKWWCNWYEGGKKSQFNIARFSYLKEFMIQNPPTFAISDKCCYNAKKNVAKHYKKENEIQLSIFGVRKAEGGIRMAAYKNCFTADVNGCDEYRPLFWYSDADRKEYEDFFGVCHSRCYEEYGMKRTGCAGCPFGSKFESDLETMKQHEPLLYKAATKIFGDSYEYTRKYRKFKDKCKNGNLT